MTTEMATVTATETIKSSKAPKSKKVVKVEEKRGRGRPPVYTGSLKTSIVAVIRKNGLTKAREILATEGVVAKKGKPKLKVKISMPTLGKLAKEAGIELFRGRPKVKAA